MDGLTKRSQSSQKSFFGWIDVSQNISGQTVRERRKRSKKDNGNDISPKLLLSRKQLLALQTALYQYAHNVNALSDIEEDKLRNLYIKDLKNL